MTIYKSYAGEMIKITREELAQKALELKPGEKINFDSINSKNEIYFSYAIEKIKWLNSVVVLIGGYGFDVMACANKNVEIIALIEKYFNKNKIGNEIFLEIGEDK